MHETTSLLREIVSLTDTNCKVISPLIKCIRVLEFLLMHYIHVNELEEVTSKFCHKAHA